MIHTDKYSMATISELEKFKMSDAVKFHKELNPNLWMNNQLDPEVKDQLMVIAEDFISTLGISDLDVVDVTISGSNAAYSYTPHSDLDLHIIVDMSKLRDDAIYRELFNAKKTLYNDSHDITVHGVPVELYVQDANEPVKSLGEYSVLDDEWIRIPKKTRANFDQAATKAKFDNLADIVELALKTKDLARVEKTIDTVKRYRKAGLEKGGEFGPENLAFKAIRSQGGIQSLYDLRNQLRSEKLSIEEEAKLLDKPEMTVAELAAKHNVPRMVIASQLDKGIKVELEHTSHRDVAREIALDHLAEDPRYYDKLDKADLEETLINETAEESQLINLISKKAASSIFKVVRKKESQLANIIAPDMKRHKLQTWGISAENLGVPYTNDPVLSKILDHTKFRVVDYVSPTNRGAMATYDSVTHDITVYYPALKKEADRLKYQIESYLAKTIAHEIQHAVDNFKSKGMAFTTGKKAYATKPYEINARFQEALMNITLGIEEAKKEGVTINKVHLGAFIDQALKHNYIAQFLPKDGKRYRQLVKRAYKFFEAEMNNPKREQPLSIVKRAMNWILEKPTGTVNEDLIQLDEIDAVSYLGNISLSDSDIIANSVQDGTIGSRPVFLYSSGPNKMYFFFTGSTIDALVYLHNGYLTGMKNITKNKGMIYNLFQYIVNMKGIPIQLGPSDGLTKNGVEWLLGQITRNGFNIVDQDGNPVDPDMLYDEWETARTSGLHGPTSISISETAYRSSQLKTNESLLMPMDIFGATLNDEPELYHGGVEIPELFEASGYIPSAKEKNDPRFKTALTVDVKPDAIKKNAKAFGFKTSRAGIPPQARADGKIAESLMNEWKAFLAEDEQQGELFPGYDQEHREKRLDNWLQSTHAWDGHKPRIFYHATTKDFDTFNTHGTGFASALGMAFEVERHGSFFAADPKFAEEFIEDMNRPGQYKEGGRVIPVYLSVQNPIDLRDNNLSYMTSNDDTVEGFKANDIDLRSIYYHVGEYERWELFDGPEGGEFVENLQKLGFDSAIINERPNQGGVSGEVWVVFNPNQVKSVHNRGSFSPDDPSLMKENG